MERHLVLILLAGACVLVLLVAGLLLNRPRRVPSTPSATPRPVKWDLVCTVRPPRLFEKFLKRHTGLGAIRVVPSLRRMRSVGKDKLTVFAKPRRNSWTDKFMLQILAAALGGGPAQVSPSPQLKSSRAGHPAIEPSTVTVVTASNNWEKAAPLLGSAQALGYRVVRREIDKNFSGFSSFAWDKKMRPFLEGVRTCDPMEIVVLADAFDVLIQLPPQTLIRRFKARGKPILLGLERNVWPAVSPDERRAIENVYGSTGKGVGNVQFVCSGVIIGRAWAIRTWLENLADNNWLCPEVGQEKHISTDDQRCAHRLVFEHPDCVALDTKIDLIWHTALWKDENDLQRVGQAFKPRQARQTPVIVHGNGGVNSSPLYWNHVLPSWKQTAAPR